jgi:cobalt-zinc-cadmium efflux system outer membrane protein
MAWVRTAISISLLLLVGCRSNSATPRAVTAQPPANTVAVLPTQQPPDAPAAPSSEIKIVSAEQPATAPPSPPPTAPVNVEPIPPGAVATPAPPNELLRLDLVQAIETGLAQNPDLVALRRNEGVSLGALGVARTYPFNPFVQIQATPLQQNQDAGAGTVYHYVLLMQTLQLAHQQQYREEAGLAQLTSVRWNIHQAELVNLAATERLFFTALYLRGIRDLVRASADANQQLFNVLQKQFEAGQSSAADVAIARLDSRSTRKQAELAEANYQTALLDLRRQLGLPLQIPFEPAGDLTAWQWRSPTSESSLHGFCPNICFTADGQIELSSLVAGRPDVMAARADLAAARANASLANASRRPDLQVGPYYQRSESGTTYWGFRAQSDIPVINSGVPLLRQREAEVRQRLAVWQQLQNRAQIEAQAALDRYERARRVVAESAQDFTESLPSELQRLEEQFRAGEVDVLRVFTARTSMIQVRRAHLDTLNELAQATAALSAATGLPPEALVGVK